MNTKFLMTEHSFGWWLLLGCWVSILSWSASAWAVNNMSIMASNRLISSNMTQRYTGQSTFTDNQGDWSVTYDVSLTDGRINLDLVDDLRVMRTEGEPSPGDLPIAPTMCDDAMKLLKNVFHKNMTFSTLEDLKIVTVADTLLAGKLVFSDVSLADGWLNVGMSIP